MNDADTDAFVARFLGDVADLTDPRARANVDALLADVGALLSDALARGGEAWRPLYHRIASFVGATEPYRRKAAHVRLKAFVDENADLAGKELVRA